MEKYKEQIVEKLILDQNYNALYQMLCNEEYLKNYPLKVKDLTFSAMFSKTKLSAGNQKDFANTVTDFILLSVLPQLSFNTATVDMVIQLINQFLLCVYVACIVWSLVAQQKLSYQGASVLFNKDNYITITQSGLIYDYSANLHLKYFKSLKDADHIDVSFSTTFPVDSSKYLNTIRITYMIGTKKQYRQDYNINLLSKKDILSGISNLYK